MPVSAQQGSCCPNNFVGFCLSDGTPIAVVIDGGTQTGWINILTGVFTPGAPPVGTVICSDQRPLDCTIDTVSVCPVQADSVVTRVGASITSVTLLAPNTSRKMVIMWNDSTATVSIKLGLVATSSSFTWRIGPQSGYEIPAPCYVGEISGLWDSANGAMLITELV